MGARGLSLPPAAGEKGNGANQHEKELRKRSVKDPDGVLEQNHAQSAEHPLQNHGSESGQPQASQPFGASLAAWPNPARAQKRQPGEGKDQPIRHSTGHGHRYSSPKQEQDRASPAHERAGVSPIEPQAERDRQQADAGSDQAMGVLVEDSSHPL